MNQFEFQTEPKIYSFDADFQLVRKTSAGKQWDQPKHQDKFFMNQEEVDTFIGNYSADKKKTDVVYNAQVTMQFMSICALMIK